ncbi:uncharacterized protein FFNC_11530 [Fusarium fujikuroi]|nr:uncharacterized protein FFC1_02130 [Fusarium fujikuroi]SCO47464.1 uncharacterized protein FFNC_11530 [Fusarium fujikuroi]
MNTGNAPGNIAFSSAVHLASSVSWSLHQLSTIPALPLPTNITAVPEYEIVSKLAPALPPIQVGASFGDVDDMIAGMIAATNVSSPDKSIVGRQSTLRVMVVGDSMSQATSIKTVLLTIIDNAGREGDFTWRYRIWQFFKQNGIEVEMVGPYKGTVPPDPPTAPSPPILYGKPVPTSAPKTSGGYAADVDEAFLANCNHFSACCLQPVSTILIEPSGRAVAVDKGLIQTVLQATPADLILFMLGFNDMGWFYSDAAGTLDSVDTFVANARAANPNVKIAMADVPQRSFIRGRDDLIKNTEIYNKLLPGYISKWSTKQSPIHLVQLADNYVGILIQLHTLAVLQVCVASVTILIESPVPVSLTSTGTDGLHPNAWGEFQIAAAFSKTLVEDFNLGTSPVKIPSQDDSSLGRPLQGPSNFRVFSSPQGVTATWDPVYGAYSYDVTVSINGGANTYSPTTTSSNRWDSQWPLEGWTYTVSVRARYGDYSVGPYTSKLSAKATPKLSDPPQNVEVAPAADGFTVTWDPPTGPNTDSIVEYNILYWDWNPDDCEIITGAAFTSSPAAIKGLTPGRNYLIAPVTWNENGQGLPFFANNAVPGAGTPPVPSDLKILSTDSTSVHITWTGSDSAGGYHVWNRNVNQKDSKFEIVSNVTGSTCLDDFLLFPGTWNYEWCISAYNGNEESPQGPAKLAPSPASGVDKDASAPTCPTAAPWCPAGASVSVPPGQGGTLPPTTGVETITTNGMTLTITTLPASTDDDVTSTMTTVPPGVSLEDFTDFPVSTNIWITTTGKDSSTTVVPVILPCPSCEPVIVWDTPEIPKVKFKWPKFPELPTFHLPCIKVFGIKVSGQCPKPEGPAPINDGPPPRPRPSGSPPSDPGDDPCDFDMKSGMCDNGNYPVYDPGSNTISCDVPSDQLGSKVSQCQSHIDSKLDAVKDYLQGERSCCPASSKAKRQESLGLFSSLINRSSGSFGFRLGKRAGDYCPAKNEDPRNPPTGKCYATYTCPDKLYPNVCGNAKSAINIRGATSILTHQTGSKLHDTSPWYKGRWKATSGRPQGGWKLDKCQVEEYPFGSGNPDRKASGNSVLRLIPGGGWEDGLENQLQGASLSRWIRTLVKRYNEFQKELTGTDPKVDGHGFVYCVEFDPGFANYLPEDLADQNFCASPYGVEFTLVNDYKVRGVRTWDPWFDVPGTDRKKPELIEYNDPNGDVVVTNPSGDDYAVYAVLPPTYCRYPSPGQQKWDKTTQSWSLDPRFTSYGRRDDIASFQRCTDPPADADDDDSDSDRLSKRYDNQTQGTMQAEKRTHARDLISRQGSSGGFHDPNIYQWLGCGSPDDDIIEDADGDPCADDSNPCGDGATNLATTNGVAQSLDPLPASGVSTGAITSWPPHYTATDAPSYVPCSTHNADPDGGIARGYCVCSGSTFALSTDSNATPANRCAYTSPLPKTTVSVSQLPTGPTASAPSPSPYVLIIYTREIEVAGHGGVTDTWWWDCRPFDKGDQSDSDVCAIKDNPIVYSTAIGRASPSQYPTSLATFSLHGHSSCSYQGPNTATVGSVVCDDGLTAKCTAAPEASQTSFVDCTDGDEVPNGLARDL